MATETDKSAPAKKGSWILLGVVALVAIGAGVALPHFLPQEAPKKHAPENDSKKPAIIPFGDVVVNLGEERLTRYLRLKIILVVDGHHEKTLNDHIQKQKAYLKSWLISYLSDQSIQEVSRAAGVNRVRREIRDQFNAMLFPDGSEKIFDVLFDEFVVQ